MIKCVSSPSNRFIEGKRYQSVKELDSFIIEDELKKPVVIYKESMRYIATTKPEIKYAYFEEA